MNPTHDAVEIQTGERPDAAVIWLHGLGADAHDFEPIVPELRLPSRLSVRFVFPNAPVRPVTINGGMPMRAWYDIVELGGVRQDEAGIRASERSLVQLIERENARGIDAGRIVVAGFSQGGAIALQTGLRYPQALAGILALSTWLPLHETLEAERSDANAQVAILCAHGVHDDMVGIERARASRAVLEGLGYPVQWREYRMGHAVCAEEIADIGAWLESVLGTTTSAL
ncbi:MAG: alpha/beta hydrolase-fold protein [Burkholderiaceae bacterium]|jgi:phospholipase/carboxylesterase|nr:alpha/beta hydrolase-fold protein [Burkholderiaceae bacterium]